MFLSSSVVAVLMLHMHALLVTGGIVCILIESQGGGIVCILIGSKGGGIVCILIRSQGGVCVVQVV